jgi:Bacterial tandem repeat domain 1
MRSRTLLASALPVTLLAGAMFLVGTGAKAQGGRVLVTQMFIENCEEMGNCELRLTCKTATDKDATEMIPAAIATNPQTLKINKPLKPLAYPTKVSCTLYEDDGLFGATWDEAVTGSIDLEGGGDYKLKLDNPEQAAVEISIIADSFRVASAPPPPAPAPGKTAAKPPAGPAVRFLGVFDKEPEPTGHAVVLGLDEAAFLAEAKKLADKGVHPTDIETWTQGGRRLWGGIFRSGPDTSLIIPAMAGDAFLKRWEKLNNDEEMRLVDLEVYQDKGKLLFAGAFRNGSEDSSLWVGQDRDPFKVKWQQLVNSGVRLVDLEVYKGSGGKNVYAGVFLDAPGSYGMWNAVTWDKFLERWKGAGGNGLADIESYTEGGKRLYDGVVLGGGGAEEVTTPLDMEALHVKWRELLAQGYRLTHFEVEQ